MSELLVVNHPVPSALVLPNVIAAAGGAASRRYVEFFVAEIRNANTKVSLWRRHLAIPGLV